MISGSPRALMLTFEAPTAAARHAGGVAVDAQLQVMRANLSLAVVCFKDRPPGTEPTAGVEVTVVRIPRRSLLRRARDYAGFVFRGLSPGPALTRAFVRSPEAEREIMGADVLVVQYTDLLPLLRHVRHLRPDLPVVCMVHDVVTQSLRRRAGSGRSRRIRWEARLRLLRGAHTEVALLSEVDLFCTFSDKDVLLLRQMGVRTRSLVLPPALVLPSELLPGPGAQRYLFVAAFNRAENQQAARWLVEKVHPRVRRSVPEARLQLIGAGARAALGDLAELDVEVIGDVDDLTPYYLGADVVVAPLLTGAGLKFKVPQALAYGRPVVTTSVGAEGMPSRVRDSLRITDDPETFAAHVVDLLQDRDRAADLAASGRAAVVAVWDQRRAYSALAGELKSLARS